jgi:Flp pilus assembly protein TadD
VNLWHWQPGEAKQALMLATTLAPELPNPYSLLGSLHLEQAEPNKAIGYFQKAVELKTSAPRLTALGVGQLEAGNIEGARNSLSEPC